MNWTLVERTRQLAGLKGYVTNIPTTRMTGHVMIDAYHALWQVERSSRMAKSALRARPIFHLQRDSIEVHVAIVFAARAISRNLQDITGVSIKMLVRTLRPQRSATFEINGNAFNAEPILTTEANELLRPCR